MTEFPSVADRLAHISSAIDAVREILLGISDDALTQDEVRQLALERLFEIICIASSYVPTNLKADENGTKWEAIDAVGRRLENTRDRIEPHVLWTMSQDVFIPLKAWAERHQRELG